MAQLKMAFLTKDDLATESVMRLYIFSYRRGTDIMMVGLADCMSSIRVSTLRAKTTLAPRRYAPKWPPVRSKTCDSGRNERKTSSGPTCTRSMAHELVAKLPCVRMAPLGSPVVPEV